MGSKPDNGYKWILTVVDIFSKYAYARAMRNKEKHTVATAMADILHTQKPRVLHTDNDSKFIASDFQALLRRYDIMCNKYSRRLMGPGGGLKCPL